LEADITVSTFQSSGTALDIPKLITCLQTVNMGSMQANLQSIGRLRDIGKHVRYIYFYANNIPSHRKYHFQRMELFRNKAASYGTVMYKDKLKT